MSALLMAVAALLGAANDSPSVAMILDVKEKVVLIRGDQEAPATRMALVKEGEKISVPKGGQAMLVYLGSGQREKIKPGSTVTIKAAGAEPASAVEKLAAVSTGRQGDWQGVEQLARSGKGGAVTFRNVPRDVTQPVYGGKVLTDRPRLEWIPVDSKAYQVQITDGSGEPLWTATSKEASLEYPKNEAALERGRLYLWEVSVDTPNSGMVPIANGQFYVVSKAEMDQLAPLQKLAESKDPSDRLLAATLYHSNKLYDEALRIYLELAKQFPDEPCYHAALADVFFHAGRPEAQAEALKRAKKLGWTDDAGA